MYYLKKAKKIINKEGCLKLFNIFILKIMPRIAVKQIEVHNDISIFVEKKVPIFFNRIKNNKVTEEGIAAAHRKLTCLGDRVVIIGGGLGVSAVTTSKLVGDNGKVMVYEGGDKSFKNLNQTIKLNNLEKVCNVYYATVDNGVDIYGGNSINSIKVSSIDLPDCDVLELDCEGTEVEILRNIKINPRVIIVEIHPWLFFDNPECIMHELEFKGYKIIYRSGHDGVEINEGQLKELLKRSNVSNDLKPNCKPSSEDKYLECGARWPVVIAATK